MSADGVEAGAEDGSLFTVQWESQWDWGVRGPDGEVWGLHRGAAAAGDAADRLERAYRLGWDAGRLEPTPGEIALAERRAVVREAALAWRKGAVRVTGRPGDVVAAGDLVDDLYLWRETWAGVDGEGGGWRGEGTRAMVRSVVVEVVREAGGVWDPFRRVLIGVRR